MLPSAEGKTSGWPKWKMASISAVQSDTPQKARTSPLRFSYASSPHPAKRSGLDRCSNPNSVIVRTFRALRPHAASLSEDELAALAALIGEYDTRGQQGYQLTETFFD